MSALQKPSPQPENHPLIKEFMVHYREALADAQRSKATTDTEAWRSLYSEQHRASVKARHVCAEKIEAAANVLREAGWTEDEEKAVKDEIKSAIENREAAEHFTRQVVNPLRFPVRRMEELWSAYQARANELAFSQPMFGNEVLEKLRAAYATLPKASFDEEKGTVIITDPD